MSDSDTDSKLPGLVADVAHRCFISLNPRALVWWNRVWANFSLKCQESNTPKSY